MGAYIVRGILWVAIAVIAGGIGAIVSGNAVVAIAVGVVVATLCALILYHDELAFEWVGLRKRRDLRIRLLNTNPTEIDPEICAEWYLDCAKLMVTNDGPKDVRPKIVVRVQGTKAVKVRWDPHKEEERTINARGGTEYFPLFVRAREDGHAWDPRDGRNNMIQLDVGDCFLFDETFQINGKAGAKLRPGRNYIAVDMKVGVRTVATQEFEIWVPTEPRKSLWMAPIG
jgi:hypothetical protein